MTTTSDAETAAVTQLSQSAKFSLPARPPDLLRRQRLVDFLHENIHRKLVLIAAAAGYGKSTLLADFAHDTDYAIAWCRLDEADRDLTALVADLVTALQRAFPAFRSAVPALATQAAVKPDQLASALVHEIETTLDAYFVLVLDDFHLIEESGPISRFFDALLGDLPEQAHLLIAGRTIPPLRIAALAAQQQIAGLSEEHLRFTSAEVQALIQQLNRVALPDDEAEDLVANTEGWITGILLTTHLMWQGLIASLIQAQQAEGPLYDYLVSEVLDQQPVMLRQFLLESAVLPEMEPAVCDQVLARTDSAELLRQVESRRLFVGVVGSEFPTYQYHHLFRDFLIARLRAREPERLKALQVRAAEWYAANGMAEAAVTFYVMANQLAEAAKVAELNAETMFAAGRYTTLQRWSEQLAPIAYDIPMIYLVLAKFGTDVGQLDVASTFLETAANGFTRRADSVGSLEVDIQRSLILYHRGEFGDALALAQLAVPMAHVMNRVATAAISLRYAGLCQIALGQFGQAEESLEQAVQLLKDPKHRYDLAWALNDLALVLRVRGETARAARAQHQALAIWRERSSPGPLATALNNIGLDLHMLGQYEAALATYAEALDWVRRAGNDRLEATVLAGQADVLADLGSRTAAADLYRRAMQKVEQLGDWVLVAYLCRAMARLDRWAGNYVGALEWLRRAELASGHGHSHVPLGSLDGLRGMILVEMGHIHDGREVLNRVCAELKQAGVLVDLAQALLFRGYAEFRSSDQVNAAASLAEALALAERVGYDQMLVSEVQSTLELLEACRVHSDLGTRIAGLIGRAQALGSVRQQLERPREGYVISATSLPSRTETVEVRALGQSQVLKDGAVISRAEWSSPQTRELFLFIVDRAPIARDKVLNTFWREKPQARALNSLYQVLFRIRRAIRYDVIVLEEQECRIAPDSSLDYDVAYFEVEAQAALAMPAGDLRRLGMLTTAIDRYTGDYLADLPVEWALERRQELSDLNVHLLSAYSDELMNLTRYAEARDILARALAVEPLRDDLHGRMLVCLAGLGRRHEVVGHYRRYREILRTNLGLDPPPEIRALYAQLIE